MKTKIITLLKKTISSIYPFLASFIMGSLELLIRFERNYGSILDPGYVVSKKLEHKFITKKFLDRNGKIKEELSVFRKCPACLSDKSVHFCHSQDGFEYVVCLYCQMIYTSKVLTPQAYQVYQKELMESEQEWVTSRTDYSAPDQARFMHYLKNIQRYMKNGKLLDIGCFTGTFLECALKKGFKPSGVEIHLDKSNIAESKGFTVYKGDFEKIRIDNSFDVITMFESLEHMNNPRTVMENTFKVLNDNGLVVITVPNGNALNAKVLNGHLIWLTGMGHKNMFTPASIRYLLEKHSFSILQLSTIGSPYTDELINYFSNKLDRIKSFNNWSELNDTSAKVRGSKLLSFLLEPVVERYSLGELIFLIAKKNRGNMRK